MFGAATQNGVGVGIGNIPTLTSLSYNQILNLAVLQLFAAGEPGWLFDNQRGDTLFSDLAGTVPAVLDGVIGRQTSIAGTAGIYRTTTANPNRPTWSGLYNLLKQTATLSTQSVTTAAGSYTLYFTGSGSVALSGTATGTKTAGSNVITCTAGTLTLTVTGSVLTADLRPTDQTVYLPPYQWVTTGSGAGTYDLNGFPLYIKPTSSTQFLYIPSLALGTATVFVATGYRKTSEPTYQCLLEFSASVSTNAGSFNSFPSDGSYRGGFGAGGTVLAAAETTSSAFNAPSTVVLSAVSSISTPVVTARMNGAQVATSSATQGTGTYLTYAMYFFMRAGTSFPFSGFETCSIGRGAAALPSAAQISAAETWVNQRTRCMA